MDGDKFAQQISDFIDEKSENEYKINQATLYSSLKRLEGLKHVKSYWNDSDAGRRKYFSLTDAGKDFVNNNTSNWSYSRSIIDKLMNCKSDAVHYVQSTEPQIIEVEKIVEVPKEVIVEKIVEVEKVVEVPVEVTKEIILEKPISTPQIQQESSQSVFPSFIADNNILNKENKNSDLLNKHETTQEINFRNILNGLIKTTTVQKKVEVEELKPLVMQDSVINNKEPFNESFVENVLPLEANFAEKVKPNDGNIDFGDLMIKAAKEGYKIRVSSKNAYRKKGTLLINRLNFASMLISCLFAIVSILLI
jgi:DNA-binding PadR family transcriptional regulator